MDLEGTDWCPGLCKQWLDGRIMSNTACFSSDSNAEKDKSYLLWLSIRVSASDSINFIQKVKIDLVGQSYWLWTRRFCSSSFHEKEMSPSSYPNSCIAGIQFYVLTEFSCSNEGILLLLSCSKRQRAAVFKQVQLDLGFRKFLTLQQFSHWTWLNIRPLNLNIWNEIQTLYKHTILLHLSNNKNFLHD